MTIPDEPLRAPAVRLSDPVREAELAAEIAGHYYASATRDQVDVWLTGLASLHRP